MQLHYYLLQSSFLQSVFLLIKWIDNFWTKTVKTDFTFLRLSQLTPKTMHTCNLWNKLHKTNSCSYHVMAERYSEPRSHFLKQQSGRSFSAATWGHRQHSGGLHNSLQSWKLSQGANVKVHSTMQHCHPHHPRKKTEPACGRNGFNVFFSSGRTADKHTLWDECVSAEL